MSEKRFDGAAVEKQLSHPVEREAIGRSAGQAPLGTPSPPAGDTPLHSPSPPREQKRYYGLDAELKANQDKKYDVEKERAATRWIESIIRETKGGQSVAVWLKDGHVLCKLANSVRPGIVKSVHGRSKPARVQMENLVFFVNAARELGVPESSLFSTPDLDEEKNMGSVVNCICAFGGAVQASCPDFRGPKFGVKLTSGVNDTKRNVGSLTDIFSGYASTLEVERPKDMFKARQGVPTCWQGR